MFCIHSVFHKCLQVLGCELNSLSGSSLYSPLTLTSCPFDRSSVDEEVAPLDDGASDDEIVASTSDEEEDSSSVSSKGEPELPAESPVRSRRC